jgi:hypothetical protein
MLQPFCCTIAVVQGTDPCITHSQTIDVPHGDAVAHLLEKRRKQCKLWAVLEVGPEAQDLVVPWVQEVGP